MRLALGILLLLVGLLAFSRNGVARRPPSDAEIHDVFEAHVHALVGNAFQRVTLSGLTRSQPTEEYVPEINATVVTYQVSFEAHIETTRWPEEASQERAKYYRHAGKWRFSRFGEPVTPAPLDDRRETQH
jgi:hypothetical protein